MWNDQSLKSCFTTVFRLYCCHVCDTFCDNLFRSEYVIFFPNDSEQDRETLQQSHTYEQVTISQKYKGWLKDNKDSDTIIVYFGGNAQNTASTFLQFESVGIFDVMKNYSFFSIDYPSYGESEGSLSQNSLFQMADNVMDYVENHFLIKN